MPENSTEFRKDPQIIKPWMYRKWQEFPSLAFLVASTFIVSAAIGLLTDLLNFWLFGLFLVIFLTYIENSRFKGSALLINKNQYPRLYEIFEKSCLRMGMNPNKIRLYIVYSPVYNAFAFGIFQKSVVFNSALIDDFEDQEIESIMVHELAHLDAGHTIITSFIPKINNPVVDFLSGFYSRNCEYTCDRAALAVTKNLPANITAHTKLMVGKNIAKSIDYSSFGDQIKSVKGDFGVWLAETASTHPINTKRVRALLRFANNHLEKRK